MDDIFKRLKELEEGNSNNSLYVYYDPSNGKVIHIRNYEEIDVFPHIKIPLKEIDEKDRDIINYRVIEKQGQFKLLRLSDVEIKFNVNNDIHMIKKISTKDFEENPDFDILVKQERHSQKFQIFLSTELAIKLSNTWDSNQRNIVMYITAENDPNILYSTLKFKLNDLVTTKPMVIKLKNYNSLLPCNIVTRKIFDNYKHLEI
jgi:hypothetical protein